MADTIENRYKNEFAFIVLMMSLKTNVTFFVAVQHIIQKENSCTEN